MPFLVPMSMVVMVNGWVPNMLTQNRGRYLSSIGGIYMTR